MKNKKKNKKITAIIIVSLLIILAIIITTIAIKSKSTKKTTIEELKEYGNKVEEMDILPNTIIAKMNGEEILFHELENRRKSINYSVENGYEELKDKNAFYELLVSKLEEKMAKEYKDESNYNMNIEEERERIRKAWYEGEEGNRILINQNEKIYIRAYGVTENTETTLIINNELFYHYTDAQGYGHQPTDAGGVQSDIGQTIRLNKGNYTIYAILPKGNKWGRCEHHKLLVVQWKKQTANNAYTIRMSKKN